MGLGRLQTGALRSRHAPVMHLALSAGRARGRSWHCQAPQAARPCVIIRCLRCTQGAASPSASWWAVDTGDACSVMYATMSRLEDFVRDCPDAKRRKFSNKEAAVECLEAWLREGRCRGRASRVAARAGRWAAWQSAQQGSWTLSFPPVPGADAHHTA